MNQGIEIVAMTYHSSPQAADIMELEQICSRADAIRISSDLEHLTKEDGDQALLCYHDGRLIGLLSWFASGTEYAQINAMVHPDYRRQGVFRQLLQRAKADISPLAVRKLSYRIPGGSEAGLAAAAALGARYDRSEYAMIYDPRAAVPPATEAVHLLPATPADLEFCIACSAQAFGESEEETRGYFQQTDEPGKTTYIAWTGELPIGLIRVNAVNQETAFIYNFCILPSYQGEGYGAEVLRQTVSLLLQKPYPVIRLSVVTDNARALQLYLRCGFAIRAKYQYFSGSL